MIFLRTAALDENDPGASEFVTVSPPTGVADGDLLVLAVTVNGADVVVTPPDASWAQLAHTDKTAGVAMWVFWKYALNEPGRWVFSLSASAEAMAAVTVYGGADGWQPVEAFAQRHNASAGVAAVGGVSTSVDGEELLIFISSPTVGTFTTPAGFQEVAASTNNGALVTYHRQLAAPVAVAPFDVTFSGTDESCSFAVVLRPSASKISLEEVRGLLVGGLPADANRVYDLDPGGDYYKLFQAIALAAKQTLFDLVELAQLEILPRFARYKLPDWERVFGLTTTRAAQVGTVPSRQAQVVSRWREAAGRGSTRAAITAILGPLLGYFPTTEVEAYTTDRDLLRIEHSYEGPYTSVLGGGETGYFTFATVDGGKVSSAGARVTLEWDTAAGAPVSVTLTAPDGTFQNWMFTVGAEAIDLLFSADVAGASTEGDWVLSVNNGSMGTITYIPTVFVEGVQVDHLSERQLTAAAMFDWGVYADPAHLGENGVPADFAAARQAIDRIAFAHTQGNLLQSLEPYPDEDAGLHAAIPDEAIPT